MNDVEGILRRSIKNAMERSVSKLHNYATTHHRFISRTGTLERAVQSEVTKKEESCYLQLSFLSEMSVRILYK